MIQELIQRRGALHLDDEERDGGLTAPHAVVELLPESVCRENVVFPLELDGRTLHVAATDPSNVLLSDKLSFILNKNIRLVRHPRDAILAAIDRHYGQTETESVDSMLAASVNSTIDFTHSPASNDIREFERFRRMQRPERRASPDDVADLDEMLSSPPGTAAFHYSAGVTGQFRDGRYAAGGRFGE